MYERDILFIQINDIIRIQKPYLLYTTCSILNMENDAVIEKQKKVCSRYLRYCTAMLFTPARFVPVYGTHSVGASWRASAKYYYSMIIWLYVLLNRMADLLILKNRGFHLLEIKMIIWLWKNMQGTPQTILSYYCTRFFQSTLSIDYY